MAVHTQLTHRTRITIFNATVAIVAAGLGGVGVGMAGSSGGISIERLDALEDTVEQLEARSERAGQFAALEDAVRPAGAQGLGATRLEVEDEVMIEPSNRCCTVTVDAEPEGTTRQGTTGGITAAEFAALEDSIGP